MKGIILACDPTAVDTPLAAARAACALKAGVWFRRGRFAMVSPVADIMPP